MDKLLKALNDLANKWEDDAESYHDAIQAYATENCANQLKELIINFMKADEKE